MNKVKTQPTMSIQSSRFGKSLLAIGAVLLLTTFASTQAFAKNCKKVHLEVRNATKGPIKIKDLDYYDTESEKWRSEPVKNEVIAPGLAWQETRTLEHVHNQRVKIKVKYSTKGKKFWKKHTPYISAPKTCRKKAAYVMTIR